MTLTRPLADRVLEKCVVSGDCLIWAGAMMSDNGTPSIHYKRGNTNVRVALWREMGRRLNGAWSVRVTCGERNCVAPEHLEAFNYRSYPKSSIARAATAKAMRAKSSLTEAAIAEIREQAEPPAVLAERHGISTTTIGDIQSWHTWVPLSSPFQGLLP